MLFISFFKIGSVLVGFVYSCFPLLCGCLKLTGICIIHPSIQRGKDDQSQLRGIGFV